MMMAALIVLLVCSMLSAGLELNGPAALKTHGNGLIVLVGLNLVVLPLLAVGLAHALGLPESHRAALLLCMLCAGGASSPAVVNLARGDLSAAGPMVVVLALCSGVAATFLSAGGPVRTIGLLAAQFLPMLVGVVLVRGAPGVAARLRRPVSLGSSVALVVVVLGFVVQHGHELRNHGPGLLASSALLVAASLGLGWVSMRASSQLKSAAALTSGVRNLSLALLLAVTQAPAVTSAILVYGLIMYVLTGAFALAMRRTVVMAPATGTSR